MFLGHLQFWFYVRTRNFQLLFCKPGNRSLFRVFDEPIGPQGCIKSKSCIKANVIVSGSSSSFVSCKTPNSQLLFSRTWKRNSFGDFDRPSGPPGCVKSKSYIKLNVNVSGRPSSLVLCKNPEFPTFILQTWKRTPFSGF